MSGRVRHLLMVILVAGAVVACGRGPEPATPAPPLARPAIAIGDPAPDVAALRVDGSPVRLAELRGSVVLLNLWATWCKPCRQEIPALERLHGEFGPAGLAVIGASLDDEAGATDVAAFARTLGASYPIWLDADDRIAAAFRPIGVPASYLIDRDGVIRWRHVGPVRSDDSPLREAMELALAH